MSIVEKMAESRAGAAVAAPGVFELGGRSFVLPPMTPEDNGAWMDAAKKMVRDSMLDPIEFVNQKLNDLQAAAARSGGQPLNPLLAKEMANLALASHAAEKGKGKLEPTLEQVVAKATDLDGFRWVVHYRLRKAYPQDAAVTPAWVAEHVTDATAGAVSARLAEIARVRAADPNSITAAG
jgi:hypothetical protein